VREDPVKARAALRFGLLSAAVLAAPPACANLVGDFDFQASGDCEAPADCPAPATACLASTCTAGVCGTTSAAAGTACADRGGKVCDGGGKCVVCNADAQCASFPAEICKAHACVPRSCTNSEEDGDETDVDCGGSCPPCADTLHCAASSDCESGFCDALVCAPCASTASCGAGRYCDAPSGTCKAVQSDGADCNAVDQCASGHCVDGACCGAASCPACFACDVDGAGTCSPMPIGEDATGPNTCAGAQACDGAGACKKALGQGCASGSECANGLCRNGVCEAPPASCVGGGSGAGTDCGAAGTTDCCASLPVQGGTFLRSYDAVTYLDTSAPAKVSSFRLDRFEVTVGRFRKFVDAVVVGGWLPAPGSGKHTHLAGGDGLNAGTEPGWDAAWNTELPPDMLSWEFLLESCNANGNPKDGAEHTWTQAPGGNERRPINCINWWQAHAFCVWDGGFLPTEAEWNYAAAGGGDQRVYPWSKPATATTIGCTYANFVDVAGECSATKTNDVGSESTAGDGKWGQADLGGSLWEWALDGKQDFSAPYPSPCDDCFQPSVSTLRVIRGGGFDNTEEFQRVSYRADSIQSLGYGHTGVRCARTP
jgi:formylglycine-generating enzyme required for sulfatase activity